MRNKENGFAVMVCGALVGSREFHRQSLRIHGLGACVLPFKWCFRTNRNVDANDGTDKDNDGCHGYCDTSVIVLRHIHNRIGHRASKLRQFLW